MAIESKVDVSVKCKKHQRHPNSALRGDGADRSDVDISNVLLRHPGISDATLGMLCRLLSRPGNWCISIEDLVAANKSDGNRVVRQVNEAVALGFMRKDIVRGPDGTVAQIVYTVSDNPEKLAEMQPPVALQGAGKLVAQEAI